MLLYHVSPVTNDESIRERGVDPARSRGKMRVSWYVDAPRVAWAIAHIVHRYGIPAVDVNIYAVDVCSKLAKTWSIPGVYYTANREEVFLTVRNAEAWLEEGVRGTP